MRRAVAYLPAWGLLMLILILYIMNNTGRRLPLPNLLGDDFIGLVGDSSGEYSGIYNTNAPLADLFTPSVDYWEPSIFRWSQEAGLNPNLVATVMQIESCGHPYVSSGAGAQGLFQVVPTFHFTEGGENQLDPDTNATAGLKHLNDCLYWTSDQDFNGVAEQEPDVGLALVCYNGGPGLITDRSAWVQESHNYYTWGLGIWGDALRGHNRSNTLDGWLRAGGEILCAQALQAQKLVDPLSSTQ